MKIGILTFHCAHNYGAVLQAYALQEKIKMLGYDVEIIDYQPEYITYHYSVFSRKFISSSNLFKALAKMIITGLTFYSKTKRRKGFAKFIRDKFNLSDKVDNKIPSHYDLYIIGSDQVWNFNLTHGVDKIWFGFFETKNNAKIISYAASFGSASIKEKEKKFLEEAFKNFDGISLREKEPIPLLQTITTNKLVNVLDPTLILNVEKWNNLAIKPSFDKKYVLVYQVIRSKHTNKIANELAKQLNAEVVEIPAAVSYKNLNNKYMTTTPEEFLGWIKHADCVVTSSFHGTAFSIIYNRPFYSVNLEDGSEKRPKNLLNILELKSRLINKDSTPTFEGIDFEKVNNKLKASKDFSISYLKQYLESNPQ